MIIYQIDGKWYVKVEGGYVNRDIIPSEVKGPFSEKPVPIAKWQEEEETRDGKSRKIFTQFATPEETFTIIEFRWYPSWGNAWEEDWEVFATDHITPPILGEAYYWTGDGWEPIAHPMEVKA